jgi:hypothetical protein
MKREQAIDLGLTFGSIMIFYQYQLRSSKVRPGKCVRFLGQTRGAFESPCWGRERPFKALPYGSETMTSQPVKTTMPGCPLDAFLTCRGQPHHNGSIHLSFAAG